MTQSQAVVESRSEQAVSGVHTPLTGSNNPLDSNFQRMQLNLVNSTPFQDQSQEVNDGGTGSASANQLQTLNQEQQQVNIVPLEANIQSQNLDSSALKDSTPNL